MGPTHVLLDMSLDKCINKVGGTLKGKQIHRITAYLSGKSSTII